MSTVTALEAKTRFGELLGPCRSRRRNRHHSARQTRRSHCAGGTKSLETVRRADSKTCVNFASESPDRKGFKPLTDKEIKDAINEGRRLIERLPVCRCISRDGVVRSIPSETTKHSALLDRVDDRRVTRRSGALVLRGGELPAHPSAAQSDRQKLNTSDARLGV